MRIVLSRKAVLELAFPFVLTAVFLMVSQPARGVYDLNRSAPAPTVKWRLPILDGPSSWLSLCGDQVAVIDSLHGTVTFVSLDGVTNSALDLGWDYSHAWYIHNEAQVTAGGLAVTIFSADKRSGQAVLGVLKPTGEVLLEKQLAYDSQSPELALATDTRIYFKDYDDESPEDDSAYAVVCLDMEGKELFRFYADYSVPWALLQTRNGDTIYQTADNYVAVDASGRERWRVDGGVGGDVLPRALPDGAILFGGEGRSNLLAIGPNGKTLWDKPTAPAAGLPGDTAENAPSLSADGTAYVELRDMTVCAVGLDGELLWQRRTSGSAAPLIARPAGGLYFPDKEDGLLALDAKGALLWRLPTLRNVSSQPRVSNDGTVYVINGNELYALHGEESTPVQPDLLVAQYGVDDNPRLKWKYVRVPFPPSGYISTGSWTRWEYPPVVEADGTVWHQLPWGAMAVLSAAGEELWTWSLEGPKGEGAGEDWGFPLAGGGLWTVLAEKRDPSGTTASAGRTLVGIGLSGKVEWRADLPSSDYYRAHFDRNRSMFLTKSTEEYRGYSLGGKLMWSCKRPDGGSVDGPVFDAMGNAYLCLDWKTLECLGSDKQVKWSVPVEGGGEPAVDPDGNVYLLAYKVGLLAFRPDGTPLWSLPLPEAVTDWTEPVNGGYLPAFGPEGKVYFGSSDGQVYAISAQGRIEWQYKVGNPVQVPAVGPDGTVYATSMNQGVYALNPDGSLKWSVGRLGFVCTAPAVGPDGTVYVGSDIALFALKP